MDHGSVLRQLDPVVGSHHDPELTRFLDRHVCDRKYVQQRLRRDVLT